MEDHEKLIVQPQGERIEEAGPEARPEDAPPAEAGRTPAESPDLAAAHQKLLAEKQELYDRLLRKQAELENLRKRLQREKEDFLQHATADLIRALLPVLDGFDRALNHRDSNVPEQFYQGVEIIYGEFLEVLRRAGLAPIEAAGKIFDPHLHQAVESVETTEHRDQEIVEELQRGYKLKHKLLRPAIVKVAVRPKEKDSGREAGS